MSYLEQPLNKFTAQEFMAMSVPVKPIGIEFTITTDQENTISLGVLTHFVSIVYSEIPIYYAFDPSQVDDAGAAPNGNPDRYFCLSSYPILRAERFDTLYVMNYNPGESGKIMLVVGN